MYCIANLGKNMEQKTIVPGFYKVDESLVINKDNEALKAYKNRKIKESRVNRINDELNNLKCDIKEIKDILKGLIK